jgi:hypothetical protein
LANHHEQVIALDPGAVRRQGRHVDDHPRAVLGFDHHHAARVAHAQVTGLGRQLTGHTRQVQGDASRLLGGVTARGGHRTVEGQLQLDAISWQRGDIQRFQIGRLEHRRHHREKRNADNRENPVHYQFPLC